MSEATEGEISVASKILVLAMLWLFFQSIGLGSIACVKKYAALHDIQLSLEGGLVSTLRKVGLFLRPVLPIFIAMTLLQPLAALALTHVFDLNVYDSLGLFMIALAPSSGLGNFLALQCKADVLSGTFVSMITLVWGFVQYPVGLLVLSKLMPSTGGDGDVDASNIKLPYGSMLITLIVLSAALIAGVIIEWKLSTDRVNQAKGITKKLTLLVVIVGMITLFIDLLPVLVKLGPLYFVLPLLMSVLGCVNALGVDAVRTRKLFQDSALLRTLFLQLSVQNIGCSLGVIIAGFPPEVANKIVLMPFGYATTATIFAFLLAGVLWAIDRGQPAVETTEGKEGVEQHSLKDERSSTSQSVAETDADDVDLTVIV
jgi:hypothetical protein